MVIFPLLALVHQGVLSTAERKTSSSVGRDLPFWARPATAWALAVLGVLFAAALIPLAVMARQNPLAEGNAATIVVAACFAAVGLVVAWHRPRNPIGWLMLALGVSFLFTVDSGLYNMLNYRLGHHLPLGPTVLFLYNVSQPQLVLLPLIILLFPDGRLPSPRWWRWVVVVGSLTLAVADTVVQGQMSVCALTHHLTQVDANGNLVIGNHHAYGAFYGLMAVIFFAFWAVSVGYQVVSWRRASGERRQQLSWMMVGGGAALASFIAAAFAGAAHGGWQVFSDVLLIGVVALPVGMGVAILKYRLYEIRRIVSRTLAYAIVTGLLVGVYAGLVLLATQVLSVKSPVAVAAATLAAVALFTPLRHRVQRVVDRQFNRARYDANQTVAAFAARLKDAVDLDSVCADLTGVVTKALEPAHISVWLSQRG